MSHLAGNISPSIVAYTPRSHHRSASYSLIQFLNQVAGAGNFTIKEGADEELESRFGPDVYPGLGVVLADCLWLPYMESHHDYFINQFHTFLVDLMLESSIASHKTTPTVMSQSEIVVSPRVLDSSRPIPKNVIHPSLRKLCAPMFLPAMLSSASTATVRSLNSWLDWKARSAAGTARRRSGQTNCGRTMGETPIQIILRLSIAMDTLLATTRSKGTEAGCVEQSHFLELEEAVCELQVTPLPKDPVEKVTFALNLHNLIVRHAMILSASQDRTWRWPRSLSEMNLFFSRIGYEVDGALISVQDLRLALFGTRQIPLLDSTPVKERRHWFGICGGSTALVLSEADATTEVFYSNTCIESDIRVLFAMAHGGVGSPCTDHPVQTICPENLNQALDKAAEDYCQAHVQVHSNGRVLLPTLLSWHRRDLGDTPAKVLRAVQDWMTTAQRKSIGRSWAAGDLKICFRMSDPQTAWDCGIAIVESKMYNNKPNNMFQASPSPQKSSPRKLSLPPTSPQKSSPRKLSFSPGSPRRSRRKPIAGTTTPVQSQSPLEIQLNGFPYESNNNQHLPESAQKRPWRAADIPPMPSLAQLSPTRPQASVGECGAHTPHRKSVIQSTAANSSPTSVTEPDIVPAAAAKDDDNDEEENHSRTNIKSSSNNNNNNMEPGSNVPTALLSNISGITFGSDFDILVSSRRWAAPSPISGRPYK